MTHVVAAALLASTAAAAAAPAFAVPTLEAADGASSTGNTVTLTGSIAGDLLIGLDSSTSATPPATVPTGATWISTGIGSTESGGTCAIRAAYKIAAGADEVVAAGGNSSRRVWIALRGVDMANFASLLSAGVTYAYSAASGANFVVPALGTLPRPGVVLTFGRYGGTAAINFGTTLVFRQNATASPSQVYWTGASGALNSAGANVASYAGESVAIDATLARAAFSIWIPGAPI